MNVEERNRVFQRALKAYRLGRLDQASEGFEALVRDGSSVPVHLSYAGLLDARLRGRTRQGVELCRRAVVLAPEDPDVHLNLARVYRLSGQDEQARGILRRSLRVWPTHLGLQSEMERMTSRRRPPMRMLPRAHPINKLLGKLRARVSPPRP